LSAQGVKLISWEYPTPIENSLVFSHLSYPNAEVVLPCLIVSILALIATLIFVKKDTDLTRKPIDIVSIVFNFLILLAFVPIVTVFAWFLDITGDNDNIFTQLFYYSPTLTVFGIMASVALRRKGYHKSSLAVQFILPVIVIITFYVCAAIY
jgi:cytochrome bd-type quinol oxidase subunit 2